MTLLPGRAEARIDLLDPLFIQDPLDPELNIGRNCFRIAQVQRAFADAWRALELDAAEDMVAAAAGNVGSGGGAGDSQLLSSVLRETWADLDQTC
jgi:hypothetical protein